MANFWSEIQSDLSHIISKHLYRKPYPIANLDFCSNDYLGLSKHPELLQAMHQNLDQLGAGSTAARLVRGHRTEIDDFEAEFSQFIHSEDSLFVANGFIANMGLIDTIADSQTYVFTDRLNHASILDGIRISGAKKKYFHHLDCNHLEEQLEKLEASPSEKSKRKIIVSETLFSMDGDSPNLKKLLFLKQKYSCVLVLDEAHALGVYGPEGKGKIFSELTESEIKEIDFRVYTLGKAFGLEGGMISTTRLGKEYLTNRMRSFIYSTAPLPLIPASGRISLQLVRRADKERKHLHLISQTLRTGLKEIGCELTNTESHIIPILFRDEEETLTFSRKLKDMGFDVRAIRPPTVPSPRLRISLNSGITEEQIAYFLKICRDLKQKI
ncbi:putative 8-amino-7-oxononanoate synthase [Leptospira ryugenii]|uniref:Putative 8-amino-7-oxononanoate synthase n=1 Tax=Leptospira ryugenii TaxID=1917863 RepID=A0A2P2DZ96_9LEPT|nr:8-amino-7-oxononanoate synthase [Leptospira ryugenii]GBF49952.1 putative 8-amino-7-oxononanoate synthase [Leptospira ryugenii]